MTFINESMSNESEMILFLLLFYFYARDLAKYGALDHISRRFC